MSSRRTSGPRMLYVLLSRENLNTLELLAKTRDMTKGGVLRQLITCAGHMTLQHAPTCADGQSCKAPQLHQFPASPFQGSGS